MAQDTLADSTTVSWDESTAGVLKATVVDGSVSNTKIATMAQSTIKGRAAGAGTGAATDLTATQATAILNAVVGDSGAGGTKGLVPAPSAGDAAAGKFLKSDGTFAVPAVTDAELLAIAGLTSAADKVPYFTGSGTAALGTFTSYGRSVVAVADESAFKTLVNLRIGTDVQAQDAELAAVAGLTSAANKLPYFTGSGTAALADFTAAARTVLDDATVAAMLATLTAAGQGKQTIFIQATAMKSRSTNGPSSGTVEQTTNKNMVVTLDFDTTTQEFAQFSVWFPKSWNLSTVTFQPTFSQLTTASGGVVFGLAGVAVSDADDLDVAFGTAQTSTKTAGTLNKEYQGPESAAITIAGTPAASDRVMFQINRTVADGSDTLAQDARLHGVRLFFTTNAVDDT